MTSQTPINALVIDAGNTKVRVAGWYSGAAHPRQLAAEPFLPPEAWPRLPELGCFATPETQQTAEFLASMTLIRNKYTNMPVVVTSVVPLVSALLAAVWPDLILADHRLNLPFVLELPNPETIGADRLCNMAAAAATGHAGVLVVDAGTATTFDLYQDGQFRGGLIAPGMALAATCLGERAARLTPTPFVACALDVGRDTISAMQIGSYHVGVGGVEAVIEGLCQKYGPIFVIVTGGLGRFLGREGRFLDPDWTLRGAAILGVFDEL